MTGKLTARVAAAAALALCASSLFAQSYPAKPVTVIIPGGPGGGAEVMLRASGQKFLDNTGHPIVIDFRSGGNGVVGAMAARQAVPDGYTLLFAHPGVMTAGAAMSSLPYDPDKDFKPIMPMFFFPSVLIVPAESPARSAAELVALGKSKAAGLFYATNGNGTPSHLLAEMLRQASGIKMTQVPYKAAAAATADLLAGRVDLFFGSVLPAVQQLEAGRVRAFGISGPHRLERLPSIPTMAEAGYPSVEYESWFGLFAPVAIPDAPLRAIHREFAKALTDAGLLKTMAAQGYRPGGQSPEDFGRMLAVERRKMDQMVKELNIKAD